MNRVLFDVLLGAGAGMVLSLPTWALTSAMLGHGFHIQSPGTVVAVCTVIGALSTLVAKLLDRRPG